MNLGIKNINDFIGQQIAISAPDKYKPIYRLAQSAIYAVHYPADVKRKLKKIYIELGMTRIVKGNVYISMQADKDIKAAIKLADLHKKELLEYISISVDEKDLLEKVVEFILFKYTADSLPFNINNKYLPMLTEGWTFNRALEEYKKIM